MTRRKAPEGHIDFDADEDDDGQEIPEDEPRASPKPPSKAELDGWLTRRVVAAKLGKSPRAVQRLVTEGELHPIFDEGTWKFNPKEVADLINDADKDSSVEIIQQLSAALEASGLHVKQLVGMITHPASVLHELLARENKRLTDRVSELEDKMIETIEAHEAALTMKHERETARESELARQSRLNMIMSQAMQLLPVLVKQLGSSRVLDQVFAKVSLENLEVMKEAGVLTEQEFETLADLKQEESQPKGAVSNGKEEKVNVETT